MHVSSLISSCAQSLHALRTTSSWYELWAPTHSIQGSHHRQTPIRLLCMVGFYHQTGSAWNLFSVALGALVFFYHDDHPTFAHLAEDADDTLPHSKILLPPSPSYPFTWTYQPSISFDLEPTASNSPLSSMNTILLTKCCLTMLTQSVHNIFLSRQHP